MNYFVPKASLEGNSGVGKAIAARAAHHQRDVRALLALSLINGEPIPRLSHRQAAEATGVSRYRIALAALATPGEVEMVRAKRLRLSDVRRARAVKVKVTDTQIQNYIERVDPNRVLNILDRMTAPTRVAAAAE